MIQTWAAVGVVLLGLALSHYFLKKAIDKMGVTLVQLDAAIAAESAEETTLIGAAASLETAATQIETDLTTLLAKAAAGQDFTAEATSLQANSAAMTTATTNLSAAVTAATAADATANPPATPPPTS